MWPMKRSRFVLAAPRPFWRYPAISRSAICPGERGDVRALVIAGLQWLHDVVELVTEIPLLLVRVQRVVLEECVLQCGLENAGSMCP